MLNIQINNSNKDIPLKTGINSPLEQTWTKQKLLFTRWMFRLIYAVLNLSFGGDLNGTSNIFLSKSFRGTNDS
jgi:hypothetical protein